VDNHVVVPIHKKVRVLLTANDVIHAWWVPAFGIKQDIGALYLWFSFTMFFVTIVPGVGSV
jgi:heme/copper-type cytochrome/quinol oxidase subunit 2